MHRYYVWDLDFSVLVIKIRKIQENVLNEFSETLLVLKCYKHFVFI